MARAAENVTRFAIGFDLTGMAGKGAPAFDLVGINPVNAAAKIVAAIPLEPAAWVRFDDPSLLLPVGERLTALDAKIIE